MYAKQIYPWGTHRRFNSHAERIREKFGGRVQKLSVDAGFTCPNRDGTRGTGGCSFCLNDAFSPSYCQSSKTIAQQLSEGMSFHSRRYRRAVQYLAYFQSYTNTYAATDKLLSLYNEALAVDGVIGIVLGTRPDAINADKLTMLGELASRCHLTVEYGIESVYEKTLLRINRGHTYSEARQAIEMTAEMGIATGAHLIFGLPGESLEEMAESVVEISGLPLDSLKFHQLQIFRGTPMADEFESHPDDFIRFDEPGYLQFLVRYLERLNPGIAVERIAGETPPRFSITPPWGPRYDQLLAHFEALLHARNTWQGRLFKK